MALLKAAHLLPDTNKSFEEIASAAFGPRATRFLQVNVALVLLGCLCGNLVAIGQLAQVVGHYVGLFDGWSDYEVLTIRLSYNLTLTHPASNERF